MFLVDFIFPPKKHITCKHVAHIACIYIYTYIHIYVVDFSVLGILPPGKFPPERSTPVSSPKECSPPTKPNIFSVCCCVVSVCSSLASLALGLKTLVGTGSRQRHISQSQASLGWNFPGGNNRGGTFRGEFSGGEIAGHQ